MAFICTDEFMHEPSLGWRPLPNVKFPETSNHIISASYRPVGSYLVLATAYEDILRAMAFSSDAPVTNSFLLLLVRHLLLLAMHLFLYLKRHYSSWTFGSEAEDMSAEPRSYAFDRSWWSCDGSKDDPERPGFSRLAEPSSTSSST